MGRESTTSLGPTSVLEIQLIHVLASTLFQLFDPGGLVVMSLEHPNRGVHPLGDYLDRNPTVELPRNAPRPYLVWRLGRRAGARFGMIDVLARFSLVSVGTGCV